MFWDSQCDAMEPAPVIWAAPDDVVVANRLFARTLPSRFTETCDVNTVFAEFSGQELIVARSQERLNVPSCQS